jgi:hypothetical protein
VKYRVTILPGAKRQMLEQALWWTENRSAKQALDWLEGFERSLSLLAESPDRCAVARESDAFDFAVRELHYGLRNKATHRAVFEIRGDEVIVYSVCHLAQRDLTPDDIGT